MKMLIPHEGFAGVGAALTRGYWHHQSVIVPGCFWCQPSVK